MDLLFLVLIFFGMFAIYDALRRLNSNVLDQTEEIKKLREEVTNNSNK